MTFLNSCYTDAHHKEAFDIIYCILANSCLHQTTGVVSWVFCRLPEGYSKCTFSIMPFRKTRGAPLPACPHRTCIPILGP